MDGRGVKGGKTTRKTLARMYALLFTALGPQHWWPAKTPFEVIVGAMLTQNTNWGNVVKTIANLKAAKKLSPQAIDALSHDELAALIVPAGYFNVKARRLKNMVRFFIEEYGGSIARMKKEPRAVLREKLLGVNGVGPETADSILLYALDKPSFVVDAYTKRIFARHALTKADADYHAVQKLCTDNLDEDVVVYNEFHALLVRVGNEYCRPKPRCGECPLRGHNVTRSPGHKKMKKA